MMQYSTPVIAIMVMLLTACGGSSSGSSDSTDGGTTAGSQMDGEQNTSAGGTSTLSDIAGVWDMSIAGDEPRSEYWDISTDGVFNTYTYREFKDVYIADAGQNLPAARCFENQTNTITAIGNNMYRVEGLFSDERFGASPIELAINSNGTMQSKYVLDTVICSQNGCSTQSVDMPVPRASSDFNANDLFLCPKSIVTVNELLTTEAEINDGNYWSCDFVNQDDRAAVIPTVEIRIGSDGQGLVTANNTDRAFTWFTRTNSDLEADYIDGSGTFILNNLVLYSVDNANDRFTALDTSIRAGEDGGAPITTYFEMDCNLVVQ